MNSLQGTADWAAQRTGKITGSRVAAILNKNPHCTRDEVMREMVREHFGYPSEFISTEATEWGKSNEHHAIDDYERIMSAMVVSTGFIPHPTVKFLGASPDGLIGTYGLLEAKCPYWSRYEQLADVPHYTHQIQLQLLVTGRAWCDFVIWRDGDNLLVERIKIDNQWWPQHKSTIETFYTDFQSIIASGEKTCFESFLEDLQIDKRNDTDWNTAESAYIMAKTAHVSATQQLQKAKNDLIALAAGKKCQGNELILFSCSKRGAVNYSTIVNNHLSTLDVEPYRGKKIQYWAIKRSRKDAG